MVSIVSGGVGRGCGCGVKVVVENHETCELNESMVRDLPAIALQPVLVTRNLRGLPSRTQRSRLLLFQSTPDLNYHVAF